MGIEERRKREKEGRRSAILKAARKLFFEKGFKSVTVAQIAKKAELSKGAVYLYFSSKEEIYSRILLFDIEKFHERVSRIVLKGESASKMLENFAQVYIDFFLADRELFRILMAYMVHTDHNNLSEEMNNCLIRSTNKTIDTIEDIIRQGVASGEFPPHTAVRQSRNALWGLLNGGISLHLFTGKEESREQMIRSTIMTGLDHYIHGLKENRKPHILNPATGLAG
ncbi:MAG: TetR/AcrR family transcriptional regulator [Syntrophales bacterium]|nr:TetR/AcrR family transcriptional regulator [Syntrophales bacterium]HPL62627.1 TetR/AcrR family transcriptional regulator [Syntrophales bacterium]